MSEQVGDFRKNVRRTSRKKVYPKNGLRTFFGLFWTMFPINIPLKDLLFLHLLKVVTVYKDIESKYFRDFVSFTNAPKFCNNIEMKSYGNFSQKKTEKTYLKSLRLMISVLPKANFLSSLQTFTCRISSSHCRIFCFFLTLQFHEFFAMSFLTVHSVWLR